MNWELSYNNIDVLTYEAGHVDTKMTKNMKDKTHALTPFQATYRSLQYLGRVPITQGAFFHELLSEWLIFLVP